MVHHHQTSITNFNFLTDRRQQARLGTSHPVCTGADPWSESIIKKAQQRKYFLCQPRKLLIQCKSSVPACPPSRTYTCPKSRHISADPSQPWHNLFKLLPSERCYTTLCTKTTRHKMSLWWTVRSSHCVYTVHMNIQFHVYIYLVKHFAICMSLTVYIHRHISCMSTLTWPIQIYY